MKFRIPISRTATNDGWAEVVADTLEEALNNVQDHFIGHVMDNVKITWDPTHNIDWDGEIPNIENREITKES